MGVKFQTFCTSIEDNTSYNSENAAFYINQKERFAENVWAIEVGE